MGGLLLLGEMFSDSIASRLRAMGNDVRSVVASPDMVSMPDDKILARATADGCALAEDGKIGEGRVVFLQRPAS